MQPLKNKKKNKKKNMNMKTIIKLNLNFFLFTAASFPLKTLLLETYTKTIANSANSMTAICNLILNKKNFIHF